MGALDSLLNYVIGGKTGESKGVPIKISIDPDLKRTIITSVVIASLGIGAGIATGIVIASSGKTRKRISRT